MAWMPVKINNGTLVQAMPTYIIWVTKAPKSTMVNKIFCRYNVNMQMYAHTSNQEMYCISIKQKQAQGDPIKVKYKGRLFIVIP